VKQILLKIREQAPTVFINILMWSILIILVRGCIFLVGPSEAEKVQKRFLETFLAVDQKTWKVVQDCDQNDFSDDFVIDEETSINCKKLFEELLSKFRRDSALNTSTRTLIENERPNWLSNISELNLKLSSDNIDVLYDYLENSVHYCVASSLILNAGNESELIPGLCVSLSSTCLSSVLEADPKSIKYPCDPFSGAATVFYLKDQKLESSPRP
jgi:hypothetical protein